MLKTASVNVRVEQNIKEQAEMILAKLGISASAFIDMTYRQVILHRGIPYDVSLPASFPTLDAMTNEEFNTMMAEGLHQAKNGDSVSCDSAAEALLKGLPYESLL